MTRILVCWEDRFHDSLDLCLRRAVQHVSAGAAVFGGQLFFDDARGNGGFVRYVRNDWPILATKGLPKSAGPIEHIVLVADADRTGDCCGASAAPPAPASTLEWLRGCDEQWTHQLRREAPLHSDNVHGRFLRWSKESLVLAAHDVPEALRRLGCHDIERVREFLESCKPAPSTLASAALADHYRRPGRCMEDMITAGGGRPPKKRDPPVDDAINEVSRLHIGQLCTRIPELAQIAAFIAGLTAPNR